MRLPDRFCLAIALGASIFLLGASSAHAVNRGNFANTLTNRLGAKVTLHTRRAWQAQMQAEGGSALNNPFNTTQTWAGATCYNTYPCVKNYQTAQDGINATVKTLSYPNHGYGYIVKALKNNAPATVIVTRIGESDWGTFGGLALAVLDDIKHNRSPNTLSQLEHTHVAG